MGYHKENDRSAFHWKSMNTHVLIVAHEDGIGLHYHNFAAYVGAVEGMDHSQEWRDVARTGSKVPEAVARLYFPELESVPWRP